MQRSLLVHGQYHVDYALAWIPVSNPGQAFGINSEKG